jgi:hypothetical protein
MGPNSPFGIGKERFGIICSYHTRNGTLHSIEMIEKSILWQLSDEGILDEKRSRDLCASAIF